MVAAPAMLATSAPLAMPAAATVLTTVSVPSPMASPAETVAASHMRERMRGRHRFWSIRDISRRLWLGRGYELLCAFIRAGILPTTRSTRTWWLADSDVQGLMDAFDAPAGKIHAFRHLDEWLRGRCYVAPVTSQIPTALQTTESGLVWRGAAYLPKAAWLERVDGAGRTTFRHRSGVTVEPAFVTSET